MVIKRHIKSYLIFYISIFIMMGVMGTRPLVALLAAQLEASHLEIGIIVALFPLFPFVFVVKMGQLIDKFGSKKPILLGALFGGLALFIPFLIPNLWVLSISQIIAGVSHTLYVVSAQRYIGNSKDSIVRDKGVMIFSMGIATGSFVGPLIGGVVSDWFGYPAAFAVLAIFFTVIPIILGLFLHDHKDLNENDKKDVGKSKIIPIELLKVSNLQKAFLISILVLLGREIYIAYFPLLAKDFGLSATSIGMIVSLNMVGVAIIRVTLPYLLRTFDRNMITVCTILGSGLFMGIITFTHQDFLLGFFSFLLGMGLGLGQPLSLSTTLAVLPSGRIGEGLGLRISMNRVTQTIAPVLFGGIAGIIGITSMFWVVGGIIILGSMKTRVSEELIAKKDEI